MEDYQHDFVRVQLTQDAVGRTLLFAGELFPGGFHHTTPGDFMKPKNEYFAICTIAENGQRFLFGSPMGTSFSDAGLFESRIELEEFLDTERRTSPFSDLSFERYHVRAGAISDPLPVVRLSHPGTIAVGATNFTRCVIAAEYAEKGVPRQDISEWLLVPLDLVGDMIEAGRTALAFYAEPGSEKITEAPAVKSKEVPAGEFEEIPKINLTLEQIRKASTAE